MDFNSCFKENNVAVVTGASSGIGRAMARTLVVKFKFRVILADIDVANLKEAEAELLSLTDDHSSIVTSITDVSDIESVQELAKLAYSRFGRVDILMNNAGIDGGKQGPLAPLPAWHRTLSVNMWGVIHGCQVFVPLMKAQDSVGIIINTGSKQGITAPPGNLAYNVSKAAVKAYTEGLQHELRNTIGCKLQSYLLVPGWTNTSIALKTLRMDSADKGAPFDADAAPFHEGKPAKGAWSPDEVISYLLARIKANSNSFYIICPDNETSSAMDKVRMTWAMQDVTEDRPPLSRWHPDWKLGFDSFAKEQLARVDAHK